MTETRFKIVFDGELMPDISLEQAQSNLAELFKSSADRIASLFSGSPVVLKRDLGENEARQYQQALQKAGANVRMEADQAASLSLTDIEEAKPQAADNTMACPKCGHQQARADECVACGVIIEKYLTRQAEQASAPAPVAASPYAPPRAQVDDVEQEVGELKLFGITGRIGRLRYIAWSFVMTLIILPAYGLGLALTLGENMIGGLLILVAAVVGVVVSVQFGVKRLHDIGWSGWLWLLQLIPLVGSIFALIMLVAPGTPGRNQYGATPPPNTTAVLVLAWLMLGLVILGVLAAIALPTAIGLAGLQL